MPALLRYVLLQAPGWGIAGALAWSLAHFGVLPAWVCGALLAVWVLKDAVVYPFVRTAYASRAPTGTERLIGSRGVTKGRLDPTGYIHIGGELWRARCDSHPIDAGTTVTVQAARGLTLVVIDAAEDDSPRP